MAASSPVLFKLSGDLLGHVLLYLPKSDMAHMLQVCRVLQRLVEQSSCLAGRLPLPYQPLEATEIGASELQGIRDHGNYWEMNLSGVTADQSHLFVAKLGRLYVYRLPLQPIAHPVGEVVIDPRGTINQIAMGFIGDVEVVVVVTHQHRVAALNAKDIAALPLLAFINRESTWSISCHARQGRLAVGSNAFEIVTFHFTPQLHGPAHVLHGHRHNIPCISYSPCGDFLASTSIDGTVRLWDMKTKKNYVLRQSLTSALDDTRHWGWSVAWLPRDAVQVISTSSGLSRRHAFRQLAKQLGNSILEIIVALSSALRTQQVPLSGLPLSAVQCLNAHFLLISTTEHLALLRHTAGRLEAVALVDVLADLPSTARRLNPCRLSLVRVMPELSAVAASTQGNGLVALYRIVQERSGVFRFVLQTVLNPGADTPPHSRGISGLSCIADHPIPGHGSRNCETASYTMYVTNYAMNVYKYRLSLHGTVINASVDSPVESLGGAAHLVVDISQSFREAAMDISDGPSTDASYSDMDENEFDGQEMEEDVWPSDEEVWNSDEEEA